MVSVKDRYEPTEENAALHNKLYEIYENIYDGLEDKNVYKKIAELQQEYILCIVYFIFRKL